MSTLASSPSPIASPRPTFHQHAPPTQPDSGRHRYTPSPSSRSPINPPRHSPRVPGAARHSPVTFATSSPRSRAVNARSSTTSQPRGSPAVGGGSKDEQGRFVDAGTQYSPDGYPPTAYPRDRKRKDAPRAYSRDHTSEAHMAASAVVTQVASEPHVREQQPATASSITGAGQSEPQEARSTAVGAIKRQRSGPGQVKMMPRAYETCNPKDLGVLIANMLMELIRLNDQIPLRDGRLTRFHSRAPPGISVLDYLQRLIQHATLSPPILLSMVYYIDRLCQLYSAFTINSLTVHRFLITAATVAAKGLSDSFWTNPTYARIGGIPVSELATLELEFLQKVQWKIVPKPETLVDYYNSLVDRTEGFELEASDDSSSEISPDGSDVREGDVVMASTENNGST